MKRTQANVKSIQSQIDTGNSNMTTENSAVNTSRFLIRIYQSDPD